MCGKSDFLDSLTYSTVAELAKPAAATTKLSYRNITMIVFLSAANKKFFFKKLTYTLNKYFSTWLQSSKGELLNMGSPFLVPN